MQIYKNTNVFVCIYVGLYIPVSIYLHMHIYHKLFHPMGTHVINCSASMYFTQWYTLEIILYNHLQINLSLFNSAEYFIWKLIYLSSPSLMDIYFYLCYYKQCCYNYSCVEDLAQMWKCIYNVNSCKWNY